jgi:hypothetical protein
MVRAANCQREMARPNPLIERPPFVGNKTNGVRVS